MATKAILLSAFATFLISGAVFFSIGWFAKPSTDQEPSSLSPETAQKLELMEKYLNNAFAENDVHDDYAQVDPENLMVLLSNLSAVPHLAGDARDITLAGFIQNKFIEYGLDRAEIKSYDVLLDYPNKTQPNKVYLMNGTKIVYQSVHQEEGLDLNNFIDAYLAYSPAGKVSGQIVYVNYGTKEDFELLANATSPYYTDVKGKICVTRYGQIFRGNKEQNAADSGCIGLIIFSDPSDVAGTGQDPENIYPATQFLPDTGISRGSLGLFDGDPETPGWPSLPNAYRISKEELAKVLPTIPCQVIGYRGAKKLLKYLTGKKVPEDWKGGILDIDYVIGGQFSDECSDCFVTVETHNSLERKTSPNVIGYIRGAVEPDRYVMIGNHRDAWGFGAIDPSSGTAQMLEIARILGQKLQNGWRPRRTIIFLSWGAEEFSLIGSREFVEDYRIKLTERGVVYINVDVCASGPILDSSASPTVQHKVIEATKHIPFFNDSYASYYDFWSEWLELKEGDEPEIWLPGAGSDHASFIFHAGVPVIDFGFNPDTKQFPSLAGNGYPTYHTAYETFDLVNRLVDPGAHIMATSAKLTLYLVRDYADSQLLDFDVRGYNKVLDEFKTTHEIEALEALDIKVSQLLSAMEKFQNATEDWQKNFEEQMEEIQKDPFITKTINDQMMNLDKVFLLKEGLPGRPIYSHAIISPAKYDSYGSGIFPGIGDYLYDFDLQDEAVQLERKEVLKKHVSQLMIVLLRAVDHLKEVYRM